MVLIRLSVIFLVLAYFTALSTELVAQDAISSYSLGSGDQVAINVYGEEDLSMELLLNDAGAFSYPFLGEIRAQGVTVSQLEQLIVSGLKGPYLIDPKVSVTILEYRRFFVNGEVKKPGGYPFEPGLTLRKAVSVAGGFTDHASRTKFNIISDNQDNDEPVAGQLSTPIKPGDIITIKESFF
jgi:protein involved in polysaccharide export with SLBB domain